MAASVIELILARVAAVLLAGATAAGSRVYRARDDAFEDAELPAINIRRGAAEGDVIGNTGERLRLDFTLAFHVSGTSPETTADDLHMAAHALLMADATLSIRGRGLHCQSIDVQTDSADQPAARLTARYQMQVFVRPGDLTNAIN